MEVFESLVPLGIVVLCLAGAAALVAMAYLFITLVKELKTTLSKVNPLLDQAQTALDSVSPALDRVDPLMERITLSVDAANLEIMRVDQILEDVNTITGNVSKATESLDTLTSAPIDAIGSVTSRIREKLAPLGSHQNEKVSAVAGVVDQRLDGVENKVSAAQAKAEVKRAERDEVIAARDAAQEQTNQMSSNLKDAFSARVDTDTASESAL